MKAGFQTQHRSRLFVRGDHPPNNKICGKYKYGIVSNTELVSREHKHISTLRNDSNFFILICFILLGPSRLDLLTWMLMALSEKHFYAVNVISVDVFQKKATKGKYICNKSIHCTKNEILCYIKYTSGKRKMHYKIQQKSIVCIYKI